MFPLNFVVLVMQKDHLCILVEDDPCLFSQITWKPEPHLSCYWMSNIHDSEKCNRAKSELTEKSSLGFPTGAVPNWCFPPADFLEYCLHFHPQCFLLENRQCPLYQLHFRTYFIQVFQSQVMFFVGQSLLFLLILYLFQRVIRNRCKIDANWANIKNWGKIITNRGSSSCYKSGQ